MGYRGAGADNQDQPIYYWWHYRQGPAGSRNVLRQNAGAYAEIPLVKHYKIYSLSLMSAACRLSLL